MAEVIALFRRQDFSQLLLHLFRFLAVAQAQLAADADTVGIADYAAGKPAL